MPEKITASVTGGNGTGTVSFAPRTDGRPGISMSTPAEPPAPAAPPSMESVPPQETAPTPTPSPFERMYPGVDPSKVEMFTDQKGKIKFKMIEALAEEPHDEPAPAPTPTPTATSEGDVAQLRAELAQRDQLMTAMLQAQMTGRPLSEVLGLTPAQPKEIDYSSYDLYDDAQKAEFVRQIRQEALATARAEVQAAIQPHQAALASAKQMQEYTAVKAKNATDPDFERKAALTTQLIGGNPNISYEATYNLVSTIQQSLGANGAPTKAAPTNGANQARQTTLTPAQQQQKAEQAARLPQSSGVRGTGTVTPPEGLRTFKDYATWVAHQQALGNLQ